MESLLNVYPVFKPIGHLSIATFDIGLSFYYYRTEGDACFLQLRLWIYGQFILHTWLGIVSFYNLFERNPPVPQVHVGRILSLVLKLWWTFYAIFLIYNARACRILAPMLYWSVGGGALILSISLAIEWKKRPPSAVPPPTPRTEPPTLPEIPFTPGKLESCPICIESFKQNELLSVLS